MTTSPPRVLVTWADPAAQNMGLRVLAEGVCALVRETWGSDAVIEMHSHNTAFTPLNRAHVLGDIGRRHGALTRRISAHDVVVDTCGGDSFTDIYGLRRLLLSAAVHRAAAKAGVPVVMAPQTIGPFVSSAGRALARRMLRSAAFVASRDPLSARAAHDLGRPVDVEATDVVFALPPEPPAPRSGVVVNVSGLLWNANPHVDHHQYRDSVNGLVAGVLDSGDSVTLLAHVVDSGIGADDDSPAVRAAAEIWGSRVGVIAPQSLGEVRSAVAGATAVVGARLHACLNALSVGTPTVPWAYSRKFAPLMESIGYPHCVDLRESSDVVRTTLDSLDAVRSPEFSDVLERSVAVGRQRLDTVITELRSAGIGPTRSHAEPLRRVDRP
ncbi:MAG: polysaccharide pyruvyl transferase family protein [Gordonia paraffinivorans]